MARFAATARRSDAPGRITTRERDRDRARTRYSDVAADLTDADGLVRDARHGVRSTWSAQWSRSVRRATARGRACAIAATCSSSVPSSPPAASSHRCSPRAPRRARDRHRRSGRGGSWDLAIASARPCPAPITVLGEGSDPSTEPALKKVYDDFKAQNPGIEWDIRAIPGLGPEWDRLARAALESGEPVGLVMIDGLFVRAWTRDGLLADLGADPRLAEVLARVPERFHLGGLGEATTRAFPLALSRGVQTTGLYYNKALLDQAGLEPPRTIADLKAMVKPLAALGAAPLVHCSGDVAVQPVARHVAAADDRGACRRPDWRSSSARSRARSATTAPNGSRPSRSSPTSGRPASCSTGPAPRTTRRCSCSSCRARRR